METRLRSSNKIQSLPYNGTQIYGSCSNTSWSSTGQTGLSTLNGTDEYMMDVVIPRFHARRKAGEVFFNPMSREKVTISSSGSAYTQKATLYPTRCDGVDIGFHTITLAPSIPFTMVPTTIHSKYGVWPVESTAMGASDVSRIQRLVSTDVLSKRGRSDSDLWEALAEYKKTIQMLNSPINELLRLSKGLLTSVEKGNTSRLLVKEMSSGYLLYRYGITPLMKDIENILKTLKRQTGKQRKTVRSSEQLHASASYNGSFIHVHNEASIAWSNQVTETVTVRAMALDEVDLSLAGNLGFSLKSLLSLPWELLSYSFVADWFANIGDFIGSSLPSVGYNLLGSSMTTHRVLVNNYTSIGTNLSNADNWSLAGSLVGSIAVVRQSTTRSGLADAGVAMRSDFGLSKFTRAADAFALIAARLVKVETLTGKSTRSLAFNNKRSYDLWSKLPGVT